MLLLSIGKPVRKIGLIPVGVVCLTFMTALPTLAELPNRNLTVELRQMVEGDGSWYSVSTQPREALMTEQSVHVRNGEKVTLMVSKAMPLQWQQSVSVQGAALSASGVTASSAGGEVKNAIVWLEAGQSLKVQPRWPGGKQAVRLEIAVESASVAQRTGTELPDQSKSQLVTKLSLPLGQWVTIASSGSGQQAGTYSSQSVNANRRLLQIRVLAP
jgi:hypothetical protein